MEIKLFEVRDRGTCLPVMAVCLFTSEGNVKEANILSRAGYAPFYMEEHPYILMCGIDGGTDQITCDPYDWDNRTRQIAHGYIISHWRELTSGDVIDVQFILGETEKPKSSEINPPPP